jgi:hypothetical protein
MTASEFFAYLLERDASRKLAVELTDIYRTRAALSQARDAEILEVHGADGGPPYLVRWDETATRARSSPAPTP